MAFNAVARAAGDAIAKIGSLAFFVAMARKLGAGGFGDFMFALSLTSMLVMASGFGTDTVLAREVARDPERVHHFRSNVMAVKGITSVGLLLVAALIVNI